MNELTVVIPTYERSKFARRALDYWQGKGCNVLMLDGSNQPIQLLDQHDNSAGINYVHAPTSLGKRLELAGTIVRTPFVALCGDDEFFLPSGLKASLKALRDDPELVAATGECLGFDFAGSKARAFLRYPQLRSHQVNQKTARERAIYQMSNYVPSTIYSVVRTKVWRRAFRPWQISERPVYAIGEIQFGLIVSILGKSRTLPCLHWMRSAEIAPGNHKGSDVSLSKKLLFHSVWTEPEYSEIKEQILAETVEALGPVATDNNREIVQAGFDAYLAFALKPKSQKMNTIAGFRSKLAKKLIKRRRSFAQMSARLEAEDISVNQSELAEIERSIQAFHSC